MDAELTFVFNDYGKVFIKVCPGDGNMPYAFAQFLVSILVLLHDLSDFWQTLEAAEAALVDAPGRIVFGRALRCEMAKANRKCFLPHLSSAQH